jgi:hypothetical protein
VDLNQKINAVSSLKPVTLHTLQIVKKYKAIEKWWLVTWLIGVRLLFSCFGPCGIFMMFVVITFAMAML